MRFASPNHEAKDFFSTSLYLGLIVTISYFPEVFVEVSLTHFEVVCGMWLVCLCLRLSLVYLLKLSLFVANLCFFKIFVTCFIFENFVNLPLWDLMEWIQILFDKKKTKNKANWGVLIIINVQNTFDSENLWI